MAGKVNKSAQELVLEFHEKYGMNVGETPELNIPNKQMRLALILEEVEEYIQALISENIVEVADALADLIYVTYGAAIEHGIDLDEVIREVHRSNLSKLNPETGEPIYREDGKVLKGSDYFPPKINEILTKQGLKNNPEL